MKRLYIFIMVCAFWGMLWGSTYTFSFDVADFSLANTENGQTIIAPADFIISSTPCTPVLPFCKKNILIPDGAEISNVTASHISQQWLTNITLASVPNPSPVDEDDEDDQDCQYGQEAIYPDSIVKLTNVGMIDGLQYASFSVTPFVYNAQTKSLEFVTSVSITIEFATTVAPVPTEEPKNSQVIKRLIENPEDIDSYYPTLSPSPSFGGTLYVVPKVEYLIITSSALKNSFEPLQVWKSQKGVYTKIITIDEINALYTGANPQLRIKQCIAEHYSNGLRWVLLGGDETIVPTTTAHIECSGYVDSTPSDMFYACLRGQFDWDANRNGILGEHDDGINLNPMVNVSRLPMRTSSDVAAYINKLLRYEMHPTENVNKMLLCGNILWTTQDNTGYSDAHIKSDYMYANYIAPYWDGLVYRFYDTGTDFAGGANYNLSSANISTQFNKEYNLIHFATHGSDTTWSTETGQYASNQALSLTNIQQPSVITTMACHTNGFDRAEPCLSEAFIRNHNGGAVCYWGSSRYGWGYPSLAAGLGPSFQLDSWFYKTLFSDISCSFSEIVKLAKTHFVSESSAYGAFRWLLMSMNAIGDAEMPIYTTGPYQFNNVEISRAEDNTLYVNTGGIQGCVITVSTQNGNEIDFFAKRDNTSTALFQGVPENCMVVITKHNYVPYVIQPTCFLQNQTINETTVINGCEETLVGKAVSDMLPQGDVVVTSSGSLEIHNNGVVRLEAGFSMEKGGKLYVH